VLFYVLPFFGLTFAQNRIKYVYDDENAVVGWAIFGLAHFCDIFTSNRRHVRE
jgi:hypothetical protein